MTNQKRPLLVRPTAGPTGGAACVGAQANPAPPATAPPSRPPPRAPEVLAMYRGGPPRFGGGSGPSGGPLTEFQSVLCGEGGEREDAGGVGAEGDLGGCEQCGAQARPGLQGQSRLFLFTPNPLLLMPWSLSPLPQSQNSQPQAPEHPALQTSGPFY